MIPSKKLQLSLKRREKKNSQSGRTKQTGLQLVEGKDKKSDGYFACIKQGVSGTKYKRNYR